MMFSRFALSSPPLLSQTINHTGNSNSRLSWRKWPRGFAVHFRLNASIPHSGIRYALAHSSNLRMVCSTLTLQKSSSLVGSDSPTPTVHSHSRTSFLSPGWSLSTIKEPLNNANSLSPILSSTSSISQEGDSIGVSTLTTALFSRGCPSHNTSITSFDSPESLDEKCSDAPRKEQPLTLNLMNVKQIDAPSSTPLRSRFSDYSDKSDDDDDSIGEICFVSSSRTAEVNKVLAPTTSISEPLPWLFAFCKAHPEYDSDYDRDTDTTDSGLNLPLESAEVGAEYRGFHETSMSNIPMAHPNPLPNSVLSDLTPPSLSTPSPCYIRSPISGAKANALSNIYEKEASSSRINPPEDAVVAYPATTHCPWWCTPGSEGSRSEHNNRVTEETKTKNPVKETGTSHAHDCRVVSKARIYGKMCSRTKSGVRTVLSIILPCIPVAGELERADEKDRCRVQQDGAKESGVTVTANDRHLTRSEGNHTARKKSCTTLYWWGLTTRLTCCRQLFSILFLNY